MAIIAQTKRYLPHEISTKVQSVQLYRRTKDNFLRFYSFEDFKNQLAVWNRAYNIFPMRPLNWQSPKDVLFSFGKV